MFGGFNNGNGNGNGIGNTSSGPWDPFINAQGEPNTSSRAAGHHERLQARLAVDRARLDAQREQQQARLLAQRERQQAELRAHRERLNAGMQAQRLRMEAQREAQIAQHNAMRGALGRERAGRWMDGVQEQEQDGNMIGQGMWQQQQQELGRELQQERIREQIRNQQHERERMERERRLEVQEQARLIREEAERRRRMARQQTQVDANAWRTMYSSPSMVPNSTSNLNARLNADLNAGINAGLSAGLGSLNAALGGLNASLNAGLGSLNASLNASLGGLNVGLNTGLGGLNAGLNDLNRSLNAGLNVSPGDFNVNTGLYTNTGIASRSSPAAHPTLGEIGRSTFDPVSHYQLDGDDGLLWQHAGNEYEEDDMHIAERQRYRSGPAATIRSPGWSRPTADSETHINSAGYSFPTPDGFEGHTGRDTLAERMCGRDRDRAEQTALAAMRRREEAEVYARRQEELAKTRERERREKYEQTVREREEGVQRRRMEAEEMMRARRVETQEKAMKTEEMTMAGRENMQQTEEMRERAWKKMQGVQSRWQIDDTTGSRIARKGEKDMDSNEENTDSLENMEGPSTSMRTPVPRTMDAVGLMGAQIPSAGRTQASWKGVAQTQAHSQAQPHIQHPMPSVTRHQLRFGPYTDIQTEAATLIQTVYRLRKARTYALRALDELSRALRELKHEFERKAREMKTIDLVINGRVVAVSTEGVDMPSNIASQSPAQENQEEDTSLSLPQLAYTSAALPLRTHDEVLQRMLVQLDAVESMGDKRIRERRRALVRQVEGEAERWERWRETVWRSKEYVREDGNGGGTSTLAVGLGLPPTPASASSPGSASSAIWLSTRAEQVADYESARSEREEGPGTPTQSQDSWDDDDLYMPAPSNELSALIEQQQRWSTSATSAHLAATPVSVLPRQPDDVDDLMTTMSTLDVTGTMYSTNANAAHHQHDRLDSYDNNEDDSDYSFIMPSPSTTTSMSFTDATYSSESDIDTSSECHGRGNFDLGASGTGPATAVGPGTGGGIDAIAAELAQPAMDNQPSESAYCSPTEYAALTLNVADPKAAAISLATGLTPAAERAALAEASAQTALSMDSILAQQHSASDTVLVAPRVQEAADDGHAEHAAGERAVHRGVGADISNVPRMGLGVVRELEQLARTEGHHEDRRDVGGSEIGTGLEALGSEERARAVEADVDGAGGSRGTSTAAMPPGPEPTREENVEDEFVLVDRR